MSRRARYGWCRRIPRTSARPQEDTSPPRRVRFDDIAFADDFSTYPDGPLPGNGQWINSPEAYPPLLVVSHAVKGQLFSTNAASIDLAALQMDLAKPWEFAFDVSFSGAAPTPGSDSSAYILLGDDSTAFNAVVVEESDASGGLDHAIITLADDINNIVGVTVPFTFGQSHRVSIRWDGTTHRAFLDGVEVLTATLRNPASIAARYASPSIGGDFRTVDWTLYGFAFSGKT
jgi:hypothetical protein